VLSYFGLSHTDDSDVSHFINFLVNHV